jgi:hypothetical protein
MGSTTFGDAKLAVAAAIVSPRLIETDRGITGRVSGYV